MLELVASVITVAGTAAHLSLALFRVAQTVKHAPEEISGIAQEMSSLSNSLNILADVLNTYRDICTPKLIKEMEAVLLRFQQVQGELDHLTRDRGKKTIKRLKWFFDGPRAKTLLRKVESIKSALTLMLVTMRFAAEQLSIQ